MTGLELKNDPFTTRKSKPIFLDLLIFPPRRDSLTTISWYFPQISLKLQSRRLLEIMLKMGENRQVFGYPAHHHEYLIQSNYFWKFQDMPMTSEEAAILKKSEKLVRNRSQLCKTPVLSALGNK